MFINFGPADIYVNDVLQGKTFKGGTLQLQSERIEEVGDFYDVKDVVYGGLGTINFYSHGSTQVVSFGTTTNSADNNLITDYAEVKLVLTNGQIILHKCKMLLADNIQIGTNTQKPFEVKLVFTRDASNKVITIEP